MERGFFEVVLSQRAVREFAQVPVDGEVVDRCLEAATHAPSAENGQPWVFVVVRDADLRESVAALSRRAWDEGGRAHSVGRLDDGLLASVDRGVTGPPAPVYVVVCGDLARGLEITMASSVYPAVQNLLLAAAAQGLGSNLSTLALRFAEELGALLSLPEGLRPMAVIPLGYPKRPPGPPRRRPPVVISTRG